MTATESGFEDSSRVLFGLAMAAAALTAATFFWSVRRARRPIAPPANVTVDPKGSIGAVHPFAANAGPLPVESRTVH